MSRASSGFPVAKPNFNGFNLRGQGGEILKLELLSVDQEPLFPLDDGLLVCEF